MRSPCPARPVEHTPLLRTSRLNSEHGHEDAEDQIDDDDDEQDPFQDDSSGSNDGDHDVDADTDGNDENAIAATDKLDDLRHAAIATLARALRDRTIPRYVAEFDQELPTAELVIGAVPLSDVQQREREIEETRLRAQQQELHQFTQRELALARRHRVAQDALTAEATRHQRQLTAQRLQDAAASQWRARRVSLLFQQAEQRLINELARQRAQVARVFGPLVPSWLAMARRRYRIRWRQTPVELRLDLRMLRGVQDKLPRGAYAVMATLYDRLGGHALQYARRNTAVGAPVTRPRPHGGRFFHRELVVDQSVYVACPPVEALRPSHVVVLEVFRLAASPALSDDQANDGHDDHPTAATAPQPRRRPPRRRRRRGLCTERDEIVAWGVLPVMTPEFQYVAGRFKVPLLRGEMDPTMDKFQDLERMYAQDLSAWLCNLYLDVVPLRATMGDRGGGGGDEYDCEIDQRSEMEVIPCVNGSATALMDTTEAEEDEERDRDRDRGWSHGTTDATRSSRSGLFAWWPSSMRHRRPTRSNVKQRGNNRIYSGGSVVMPQLEEEDAHEAGGSNDEDAATKPPTKPPPLPDVTHSTTDLRHRRGPTHPHPHSHATRQGDAARYQDVENENEIDTTAIEPSAFAPLEPEAYSFSIDTASASTASFGEAARHARFQTTRKLRFLRHELLADLSLHKLHTLEFWLLLLLLLLSLWVRVYMHYVSQWLVLKLQRVPVFAFQPQWTTCVIKYTARNLTLTTELAVLIAGGLGNLLLFGWLSLAAALGQRVVGELPALGSHLLVCVGLATVLDPVLILVVDVLNHQYNCLARPDCTSTTLSSSTCACAEGDAFKLYQRFVVQEGSGLVGLLLTAMVYAALACVTLVAFYAYLLHVHMNGRMLDVYRRLHAHEDALFLPQDGELSLSELQAICSQARRWRGAHGTQRRVFVHDYVLTDPLDESFEERTTHIAIYKMELAVQAAADTTAQQEEDGGRRELYRHFLRAPDGAIVELFGEIGPGHGGSWQLDAAPGLTSLAMLMRILTEHCPPPSSSRAAASSQSEGAMAMDAPIPP